MCQDSTLVYIRNIRSNIDNLLESNIAPIFMLPKSRKNKMEIKFEK